MRVGISKVCESWEGVGKGGGRNYVLIPNELGGRQTIMEFKGSNVDPESS